MLLLHTELSIQAKTSLAELLCVTATYGIVNTSKDVFSRTVLLVPASLTLCCGAYCILGTRKDKVDNSLDCFFPSLVAARLNGSLIHFSGVEDGIFYKVARCRHGNSSNVGLIIMTHSRISQLAFKYDSQPVDRCPFSCFSPPGDRSMA